MTGNMLSFEPKEKPVPEIFSLMLDAISPRPIAFASTMDAEGNPNLSPFSFFNAFGANPPILIFSPARRGKDNTTKHSFENVKVLPEVVINVVNYAMVQQMNLSSTEYPEKVSEFEKAGFTPLKSDLIKPFRVKESPVQMECKVIQVIETGTQGSAGNLIICEVLKFHFNTDIFNEKGQVDPDKIDLVGRMGRDYYVRASGNAIFTLQKPGAKHGIGVDTLPEHVRRSNVLTGNDLGLLGGLDSIPSDEEIIKYCIAFEESALLLKFSDNQKEFLKQKHILAKKFIESGKLKEALMLLLFEPVQK
jgi:flavin reductase (DIM6/NTAB) family NADH-FMN oxidoreductase RutF